MKDIKLLEILKSFTDEELKSFEKFLNSPFIKSTRNLNVLLNFLKKFHPQYNLEKYTKETMYQKIFSEKEFNEKKLSNYIFDLTKAAESFLIHTQIENDEVASRLILTKSYYQKKLYQLGFRNLKNTEKMLQEGFSPEKNFFYRRQMLEELNVIYFQSKEDFPNIYRCEDNYFEATLYLFLTNFTWMMIRKIDLFQYFKRDNRMVDIVEKSFDPSQLFKNLNKSSFKNNKLLQLNQLILKTITDKNNTEHYFKLKETLYKDMKIFDRYEKYMLLNHLHNAATYFNSKGDKSMMYESFELYKTALEENAYSSYENEYMGIIDYRNIFELAVTIKEFDFAADFVERYTQTISPEERTGVYELCIARIYFKKNEFEKSFQIVSSINKINPVFRFDFDILKLMLFYELKYFEQAFSKIDSHKHYIYRDKYVKDEIKNLFRDFLISYYEILKFRTGQNKTDPSFIKENIKKLLPYNFKRWLLDRSDDLIKASGKFKKVI